MRVRRGVGPFWGFGVDWFEGDLVEMEGIGFGLKVSVRTEI